MIARLFDVSTACKSDTELEGIKPLKTDLAKGVKIRKAGFHCFDINKLASLEATLVRNSAHRHTYLLTDGGEV